MDIRLFLLMIPCWYLWGFFGFFLNITTLVLIQLYLGTGILVETIVVVDILVGFFSQLARLCCWCDCWIFEYCFFTLNVLVFRCCVQSFCCRVDELVLRGVLTVVLWLYRCFVEVFWRRLNNFNRGAVRVEGTIYFFFSLQSYGPLPKVMQPTLARLGNIKRQ